MDTDYSTEDAAELIENSKKSPDFFVILKSIIVGEDLYKLLRTSISVYVKELNCITAIVFKVKPEGKFGYNYEMIFSIPYALVTKNTFNKIERIVPDHFTKRSFEMFHHELPKKGKCTETLYYHIMNLVDFGLIVLITENKYLDDDIIKNLEEVNLKLAQACNTSVKIETLENSERRFRSQNEILPEMIIEFDMQGDITFANNYAIEKLGYAMSDLQNGFNLFTFIHPDEHEFLIEDLKLTFNNDKLPPIECTVVRNNGTTFRSLFYKYRILKENKTKGFFGLLVDVTNIKENERKLKIYSERLELALLGSDAGIWDWNIETNEVVLNDKWFIIRGFESISFNNNVDTWKSLLHPDDKEPVMLALENHLNKKTPFFQAEYRTITHSGEYIWILDTGKVTECDANGKPKRMVGTNTNITTKKENELLLKQNLLQQELLSEIALEINSLFEFEVRVKTILSKIGNHTNVSRVYIFEDAQDGLSTSNTFEWCNENISPQLGELQNIPYEIIPSWKKTLIDEGRVFSTDISELPEDVRMILEPQHIKSIVVYPLFVLGNFFGFIGFDECLRNKLWIKSELELLRTISGIIANAYERRIMEHSILTERDKANDANKAKSEFLANMSHEIRTPMNAIIGFSEALYNSVDNEKHRKMIQSILSSGNLLLSLLNDILDLSKIEAGKLELSLNPVDLKSSLQDIKLLFNEKAVKKSIEINTFISAGFPVNLLLDEIRVKQILFNIVGNAVKFTHKGFVNIKLDFRLESSNSGNLTIEVEDTGIGIAETQLELIFEAFRQQSGQSNRLYGGIGLGLAIAKRLVEKMKGDISVSSQEGKGSSFKIFIPDIKVVVTGYLAQEKENTLEDILFEKATILIVDDVLSNIEVTENLLTAEGLNIISAESGEASLEILRHSTPDLILMDIRMPGMSGYQVVKEIRSIPKLQNIPIIAFTASVFSVDLIEKSGFFDGYLLKPISKSDLLHQLAKFLKHKSRFRKKAKERSAYLFPDHLPKNVLSVLPNVEESLRIEFLPKWKMINGKLVLHKIEEFANGLKKLATDFNFVYLSKYAETLNKELDMLNFSAIDETLGYFPRIIDNINLIIKKNVN